MLEADFRQSLTALGLGQYHDPLVAEAFDSWPILAQITEQDLDALDVRLGHRRILQRAIADYQQTSQPDGQVAHNAAERHLVPLAPYPTQEHAKKMQRVKRKYVRHPKVDENAPPPAPTGYVLFSNWVREGLKDQKLDFPELAKIVGQKWQALPKTEKEGFLNESKELKTRYLRQLADYKRTAYYREYQIYLVDFRARNVGVAHSHKQSRSPKCDAITMDDDSQRSRSRSESTAGEWNNDAQPMLQQLPPMQVVERGMASGHQDLMLSPISGYSPFGASRPPMPHQLSTHSDRCLQPPVSTMATRQLPPLVASFRN